MTEATYLFENQPSLVFETQADLFEQIRTRPCIVRSQTSKDELLSLGITQVTITPPKISVPKEKREKPKDSKKYFLCYVHPSIEWTPHPNAVDGSVLFMAILASLETRLDPDQIHIDLLCPNTPEIKASLEERRFSYAFVSAIPPHTDTLLLTHPFGETPQTALEALAQGKKILSTDTGIAKDLLEKSCLFTDLSQAVSTLVKDIHEGYLDRSTNKVQEYLTKQLNPPIPTVTPDPSKNPMSSRTFPPLKLHESMMFPFLKLKKKWKRKKSISLWGQILDGPYGGANQALKAMAVELKKRGYDIRINALYPSDAHLLNSTWYDVDKASRVIGAAKEGTKVVHRIDGPISLIRGRDFNLDKEIFEVNQRLATSTVFQSMFSWSASVKLGFDPVSPNLIRNACDPNLFFHGKQKTTNSRKIQLASSSWSKNARKGFAVYDYLDKHLDFDRYDYTFYGRSPIAFKNIRLVDALPSKQLGQALRTCDAYITASLQDPASNAVIEAITTGLPVIYIESGGHAEIAKYNGIGFKTPEEIPSALDRLTHDLSAYQKATSARRIDTVVDSYLRLLF